MFLLNITNMVLSFYIARILLSSFVILFAFGWLFPLFVTLGLYIFTLIRFLVKRKKIVSDDTQSDAERKRISRRFVMTRTLFVSSTWLLICYLATPVFTTLFPEAKENNAGLTSWLHTILISGYSASPVK